jgi:hypothetical protein
MKKLSQYEMAIMARTIEGFKTTQLSFLKLHNDAINALDDITDIVPVLDQAIERLYEGVPTVKDLCIAKMTKALPYTHFEYDNSEKRLWRAQTIAWTKLRAFSLGGRCDLKIAYLIRIAKSKDEDTLNRFLEYIQPSIEPHQINL